MIRADIRSLSAYHVPDSSKVVKLDAMENPYPLPNELRTKLAARLASVDINRYPDANMHALRQKVAASNGVSADQVLLGNGSDEVIQMVLMAADRGPCVVPKPSFVMYSVIARWLRRPVASVPLDAGFNLDADKFLKVCSREKASVAFLSCPNNPTGNMWPRQSIEHIVENFNGLIVIDEAYRPFSDHTYTDLIAPNIMVLRTFSKLGWAGLRLGYILGDTDIIQHLHKVRLPYNLNSLAQTSADFLLDHLDVFEKQAGDICRERQRLSKALNLMDKVEAYPSQANFILLRLPNAGEVFNSLLQHGILVKNMDEPDGLLQNCLRVTIGLPEENDQFLKALTCIIHKTP